MSTYEELSSARRQVRSLKAMIKRERQCKREIKRLKHKAEMLQRVLQRECSIDENGEQRHGYAVIDCKEYK